MRRVVAAVICEDDHYLLGQRVVGRYVGQWEFIGGKVEPGESDQEALLREVSEETSALVAVGDLMHVEKDADYTVYFYEVCRLAGEYQCDLAIHSALVWVAPQRLPLYEMPSHDLKMAALLVHIWKEDS